MTATYTLDLFAAKAEALARLLQIIRESVSETQVRLAAAAILRIPVPETESEAQPAAPSADPPLTTTEIADLGRALPNVSPARFTKKHTPVYWRAVLARSPLSARVLSPPPSKRAA